MRSILEKFFPFLNKESTIIKELSFIQKKLFADTSKNIELEDVIKEIKIKDDIDLLFAYIAITLVSKKETPVGEEDVVTLLEAQENALLDFTQSKEARKLVLKMNETMARLELTNFNKRIIWLKMMHEANPAKGDGLIYARILEKKGPLSPQEIISIREQEKN